MTTAARHPLVEGYLRSLQTEAARLPYDQARELLADIDEHLGAALPPDPSEAEIRNVLDRLGTPTELVEAAGGQLAEEPHRPKPFSSPGGAILCLVMAEVLSIALPISVPLWILGLVMMVRATVWSDRQRLLGLIALGSGMPAVFVFLAGSLVAVRTCSQAIENGRVVQDTCGGVDWVAIAAWTVIVAYLALQVFTIWWLLRSARRR
jgi:uncharacterized membrane protein